MTVTPHQHACAEVDRLQDEVRDLSNGQTVFAAEHMRMAAVFIAARALAVAFKLDSRDPNVDVDLAVSEGCQRLAVAVADAEDPQLTPAALIERLRVAIDDPHMLLERYRGRDGEPAAESMTDWQLRAVLHVLTRGVKAVNG